MAGDVVPIGRKPVNLCGVFARVYGSWVQCEKPEGHERRQHWTSKFGGVEFYAKEENQ